MARAHRVADRRTGTLGAPAPGPFGRADALACVLEGGTWATGRALARELRDGNPPFKIDSDGTVF